MRVGDPDEPPGSYDYVFVSFALHLFSPEKEAAILRSLLRIARIAVVIIDHGMKWEPFTALIEWIEGSCYDKFIGLDFNSIGKQIGAVVEEKQVYDCTVLIFRKRLS